MRGGMNDHGGQRRGGFMQGGGGFGGKPGFGKPQQDKFYTMNQNGNKRMRMGGPMGGGPGGMNNGGQRYREPFTPKELCKFFLTGSCHKGQNCTFSHNLSDFPCKYLHATGHCEKGD